MLQALLYRTGKARPLFYRVEISRNLFEEASVTREWGAVGGTPRTITSCHTDLRAASRAADSHRQRALDRGYIRDTSPLHLARKTPG
ncbi:WGR domain-containing protein [Pseudosulfitobacter koreensis]|uniref:WGR domain-containing protein n=1 Tax=Pseudosulfitobacter koreensis TaxID=2968472 RepID=A0ABT1Z1B2_9RHOB|nr:WGR domain-containing protein [Pseudosulfitobacter koreense]MCR8826929.1 WGR domain-containing protein [Pseudosulfitobacter koreense]